MNDIGEVVHNKKLFPSFDQFQERENSCRIEGNLGGGGEGGNKISLKLAKNMLETWNLVCKYTHIFWFRTSCAQELPQSHGGDN